jgi:hypothetical protein
VPIVPLVVGNVKPGGILTGREYESWTGKDPIDIQTIMKRARAEFPPTEGHLICDEGPYKIRPGEFERIELQVLRGDRIEGRIEEENGEDFDWNIVDEESLVDFMNGDEYNNEDGGEGSSAYSLKWSVRKRGPWYLVLDVPRRQKVRSIGVYLRKQ